MGKGRHRLPGQPHLFDLGHRRISYLDGGLIGDIRERRQAFLRCASNFGLEVPTDYLQKADDGLAGGYQAMGRLLSLPDRPTAVIAADEAKVSEENKTRASSVERRSNRRGVS